MKKRVLFFVLIAIAIIFLLIEGYFLFFNENEDGFAGIIKDIVDRIQNDKSDSASQQTYSGGSSSEDSAGTKGNQPTQEQPTTPGCTLQQIAYAIGNLVKNQTCNAYQNERCVDKTIKCTADVINLDYDVSGIFEVKFLFLDQEKTMEDAFDSTSSSQTLQPREEKVFYSQTQITDPELAAKDTACFYQTMNVPKKEIC